MIEEQLEKLKQHKARLKELEKDRERTYPFWTLFKYHAQNKVWFDDFQHDLRIPFAELKYLTKNDEEFEVTREFGERLWLERKAILDEIEEVYEYMDVIIGDLREQSVTWREIAGAYGATESGVIRYVQARKNKYAIDSRRRIA